MALQTLKPRLKPTTTHQPKRNWGQGCGGRAWVKLKNQILLRDNYTCQHCGRIGGQLELDHIINKARGGNDSPGNLQILCKECHKIKTESERNKKSYVFMPEWLKPIPNAILVFGCAGSGKSTWAKKHSKGRIIIDLDEIIALQSGKPIYIQNQQDLAQGIRLRNQLLIQIAKDNTPCIIILTGTTKKERDWWANKIQPNQIIIMDTPPNECKERILKDDRRPDDVKQRQIASVDMWGGS